MLYCCRVSVSVYLYLVHMNIPALVILVLVELDGAVAVHQLPGVNEASQLTGHY